MNMIAPYALTRDYEFPGTTVTQNQGVVAIVSDDPGTIANLQPVCEFLDIKMEIVSTGTDLANVLREHRPMAVISDIECNDHDGFHVMKEIARYSRDLPILLLTGGDPVLMGAADAVQDLCGLTSVTPTSQFPMAGQLVGFLFGAGRRAGCMRLVPV
jgi:CheY-like chemotaxis protein